MVSWREKGYVPDSEEEDEDSDRATKYSTAVITKPTGDISVDEEASTGLTKTASIQNSSGGNDTSAVSCCIEKGLQSLSADFTCRHRRARGITGTLEMGRNMATYMI
jgi:hypothetical protein